LRRAIRSAGDDVMPARNPADHLTSAPMSRAPRALVLTIGIGVGALAPLLGADVAGATTPPAPPPVATTVPGAVAPPPTTVALPPAGSRGGATEGSVAKPTSESWSPRRIATITALGVIALAALGYAYGKLRSAPPRHPDLARRPPDLDGVDQIEAAG
jgi:hypothetical protein